MLILNMKSIHHKSSLPVDYRGRDEPLKSFDPQFLRVGRGLECCLSQESVGNKGLKRYRLCGWNDHEVLAHEYLERGVFREIIFQ